MNNTTIGTSLDDTNELRKTILENPDLPLVIFAGEESWSGEYSYNLVEVSSIHIDELAYDGEYYLDRDDFRDQLYDKHEDEFETDKELDDYVEKTMNETEFVKAIVVYVG
jgi:hypothetical protein